MSAGRVVAGVDHTAASHRALSWAAAEASRRGAELVAVHAWDGTSASHAPYAPAQRRMEAELRHITEETAALRAVSEVARLHPEVVVRRCLNLGSPAKELLHHSEGADLLVLGSSLTASGERRLGPVLLACLRHAPCPVVAVSGEGVAREDGPVAAGRPHAANRT
ncbi:universal stress protein [Sphaerisporangium dianthi]|uniref:Universal stress protein n=1 Tax=Sphaerisporangium dianthi TaxID=1436120 RepID=A0ABV9CUY6_9ACTN